MKKVYKVGLLKKCTPSTKKLINYVYFIIKYLYFNDFNPEKIDKMVKKDKKGYIVEADVDHPKKLHKKNNELPFLEQRTKIRKVEKIVRKKFICSTHQKYEPCIQGWFETEKSTSGYYI